MASPAYEQILAVQALDVRLHQLRHRMATHPLRADVVAATSTVTAVEEKRVEIESRHHELERARKRLSDEVATIEAKRNEIEQKLYDGSVQASKELLAMQDESANLLDRQTSIEDDELELMEQIETVDEELTAKAAELATAGERRAEAEAALASALAELETELAQVEGERAAAAAPADPQLLARYEQLAPQFDNAPVARAVDGRCDGCHMQLSAVAVDRMAKAPESEVVICEECGRLLVR
ncbi:MAG: C4-type zinc ribbon domain-containing protein [Actinomycetota bacterium]